MDKTQNRGTPIFPSVLMSIPNPTFPDSMGFHNVLTTIHNVPIFVLPMVQNTPAPWGNIEGYVNINF